MLGEVGQAGGTLIMWVRNVTLTALVFAAGLLTANSAAAGPLLNWCGLGDNAQPSDYSPFRYWTPALARVHDYFHGPKISVYPPDRHPEIPPTVTILRFSQPAPAPAATLIPPTSPPPESRFHY